MHTADVQAAVDLADFFYLKEHVLGGQMSRWACMRERERERGRDEQ